MDEPQTAPVLPGELLSERLFTSLEGRRCLEADLLPRYIGTRRWFSGKARRWKHFEVLRTLPLGDAHLLLVRVTYTDGEAETYLLPLKLSNHAAIRNVPDAIVAHSGDWLLFDAVYDPAFRADLVALIGAGSRLQHADWELLGIQGSLLKRIGTDFDSRVLQVEQSNSSIIYGDRVFLKLYRRLEEGVNPDAEIIRFLSERQHFPHVPPFAGALEYRSGREEPRLLGLALGLVPNKGDAWAFTLRELAVFYARAEGADSAQMPALIGDYLEAARQLGKRTGELHLALAGDSTDPAFAPEPFKLSDQRELAEAVRGSTQRVFALLRASRDGAPAHAALINALLSTEKEIVLRTKRFETHPIRTGKTRTHGDYHLGQVLHTGADFVIIDFEGEPLRPLAWRKLKRSPLRDVAGMLRSFHYAAHSALSDYQGPRSPLEPWAESWSRFVGHAFLDSWRRTTEKAEFAPQNAWEFEQLLGMFLLEKVIYEVGYELNNRPAWLPIPARGALALLGEEFARC